MPEPSPSIVEQITGNRCGHNPRLPSFENLAVPATGYKGSYPQLIVDNMKRIKLAYKDPKFLQSIQFNEQSRKTRSEFRDACVSVGMVLLRSLNIASLLVGTPTDAGFRAPSVPWIAKQANIGLRRCERVLRRFRDANYLVSIPRKIQKKDGSYTCKTSLRIITSKFLGECGQNLAELKEQREYNAKLEEKKAIERKIPLKDRFKAKFDTPQEQERPQEERLLEVKIQADLIQSNMGAGVEEIKKQVATLLQKYLENPSLIPQRYPYV